MTNTERIQANNAELREAIEMAESLPEAGVTKPIIIGRKITENGTYTAPDGIDGFSPVIVDVPTGGGDGDEIPWLTREITEYSNPTLTTLGAYALSGTKIVTLDLPALSTIEGYAFYECTTLTEVRFPLLTQVPNNGFRGFKGVVKADFASLTWIRSNGFYQCTNLETLILRGDAVCSLVSGTTFTASKIANGTGYVYVRMVCLSDEDATKDYRRATNWSTFAAQFRPLVDTFADLASIDGSVYDRAWVDDEYCVYIYDGSAWAKED